MSNYQKAQELEDRTVAFSIQVINTVKPLASDRALVAAINQVIRSSTSIGANYAEANNASSKLDFKSKIYIAKKEAGETRYWLRVLEGAQDSVDLSRLQQEALELNLILQKIISTMKTPQSMETGK